MITNNLAFLHKQFLIDIYLILEKGVYNLKE